MSTTKHMILERLADGPEGARILAEIDAEQFAERRRLAAEIATLTAEIGKGLPRLQAATLTAAEAVKGAQDALRTAQLEHARVYAQERAAVNTYDRERALRESQLVETAPPEIGEFIHELGALAEKVRHQGPSVAAGGKDWMGRQLPGTSNYPQIVATLAAIREARVEATALKLVHLDVGEVAGKIAELRETIEAVTK